MHDYKAPVNKYEQEKVSKDKCKPMQRIFSKFLSENLYIYTVWRQGPHQIMQLSQLQNLVGLKFNHCAIIYSEA